MNCKRCNEIFILPMADEMNNCCLSHLIQNYFVMQCPRSTFPDTATSVLLCFGCVIWEYFLRLFLNRTVSPTLTATDRKYFSDNGLAACGRTMTNAISDQVLCSMYSFTAIYICRTRCTHFRKKCYFAAHDLLCLRICNTEKNKQSKYNFISSHCFKLSPVG